MIEKKIGLKLIYKYLFNNLFIMKKIWFNRFGTIFLSLLIIYIWRLWFYFYNTFIDINNMYWDVYNKRWDINYRVSEIDKITKDKEYSE